LRVGRAFGNMNRENHEEYQWIRLGLFNKLCDPITGSKSIKWYSSMVVAHEREDKIKKGK